MKRFIGSGALTGLQQRLLVLLVVALMPVFGYVAVLAFAQQRESLKQARLDVQAISSLTALGVERTVEGAHQLLNAITSGPFVREAGDKARCIELLKNIGRNHRFYTNLAVLELNGNLLCDALGTTGKVNLGDRLAFQDALRTRSFAMGDYQVGRISGKPTIHFAMPVLDEQRLPVGASVLALDLIYLQAGLKTPAHADTRVSVTDRNGTVLASDGKHGAAVGARLPDPALYSAMRALPGAAFEAPDASGDMRIYLVSAIRNDDTNAIFVVASVGRDAVTAPVQRQLLIGFLLLLLVTLSGLLVARVIANRTLVVPAQRLLKDIRALVRDGPDGPEGAREAPKNDDELAELTSAFRRVAALLKARDAERERDHAELQDAQNLLDMATRVSQLGAWRLNLNQQDMLIELSDIARAIHGLPPDSTLVLDDAINFFTPASAEVIRTLFRNCVNEGVAYDTELQMITATGKHIWVRAIGQAVRNSQGEIVRVEGALQDISAQRLAEENTTALEARLRTTLESISDGFFTVGRDWRFTYVNSQAEKLLRCRRADMLGQLMRDVLPADEGDSFNKKIQTAIREKRAIHFVDFYSPLGLWLDFTVSPSKTGFAVYFRDVTGQREAKDKLRLLEIAVSRLNDIVLITEAEPIGESGPRIVFVNDEFERRTGYQRSEVIGQTPRILQGPGTCRLELDRIRVALEKWEPVRAELLNYTKTGQEFWIGLDIFPFADETGWFTHWVGVQRDITERKRAEKEIVQLNVDLEERVQLRTTQLEAANRELEAFSYSVSHDLRSPLNTVNGFGQLLQKSNEDNLNEKGKHYLNRIRAGAQQMGELIDGLLSLAKIGREPLRLQRVDLSSITQQLERQCREREPTREMQVFIQSGMLVNGDATLLLVVMQNLFDNAWKYTKKQAAARIDVGTETGAADETIYFVKDNGAGFDMAYADKLFGVFQRLHSPSEFAGNGVGLANVKRVIEHHGGRVWAHGQVNEGATFYFTLCATFREPGENGQHAGTGQTGAQPP